ncbi:MAG: hypothetical protein AAGJ08_19285 [Cyanobacteria bacterium P01_H01_bin.35]
MNIKLNKPAPDGMVGAGLGKLMSCINILDETRPYKFFNFPLITEKTRPYKFGNVNFPLITEIGDR